MESDKIRLCVTISDIILIDTIKGIIKRYGAVRALTLQKDGKWIIVAKDVDKYCYNALIIYAKKGACKVNLILKYIAV